MGAARKTVMSISKPKGLSLNIENEGRWLRISASQRRSYSSSLYLQTGNSNWTSTGVEEEFMAQELPGLVVAARAKHVQDHQLRTREEPLFRFGAGNASSTDQ